MVFDWNLVGKCWTAQYDKDAMIAELTRRFEEGGHLLKPHLANVTEEARPSGEFGGGMDGGRQGRAAVLVDGVEARRQWCYRYEEWDSRRIDLGWKTKVRMTQKQSFGRADRIAKLSLLVGNRFQTLSCDLQDMYEAEIDHVDEAESPHTDIAHNSSRHQGFPGCGGTSWDASRRVKKNGRRGKSERTCNTTNRVSGKKGCSQLSSPQMYMFAQVPQEFEGTWSDTNRREDAWVQSGGKVIQWAPPAKYEEWYDWNHPKPEAIAASIANALREYKVEGKILLVGDSTAAYCVDTMAHVSASKLQRQIRKRVSGARYVSLRASSGAKYMDFCRQIKDAAVGCPEVFDSLVLLGGWNDDAASKDYIRGMTKVIAETWSDPFAPYLGTSDGRFIYGSNQSPRRKKNNTTRCDAPGDYLSGKWGKRKRNKSVTDLLRTAPVLTAPDSAWADTLFASVLCQLPEYNASALVDGRKGECLTYENNAAVASTTLRDMKHHVLFIPQLHCTWRIISAAAYAALGGMEDDGVQGLDEPGSIARLLERRLSSDPLCGMRPRSSKPQSDHERLMRDIDIVAGEVNCSGRDTEGDLSRYIRVCALVKTLYSHLSSEQTHQCVIDECFAICVLERISRPHADGLYEWKKTAWEKVDGKSLMTHAMKMEWMTCMECVSGFFFSLFGKGVGQTWIELALELREALNSAHDVGEEVIRKWQSYRREAVQSKERAYGPSWTVSFAKNSDWETIAGLAASRLATSAENYLFTRSAAAAHFKSTYECLKEEEPRLCFLDCVLKFSADGCIVEDNDIRNPRSCRFYQFFNFELLSDEETEKEREDASVTLRQFLSATWHGNSGAHHAEMMAITLAFAGREVGRFFVLTDRSDAGKTTHDTSFCYFLGSDDSSGRGSMSGTLHADWLCDEKAIGFEGHHILHCKFTFTPELSTRPILNDTYKRIPTLVTQKLRKPHSDLVFDATFGRCLHFLETNFCPRMQQRGDDVDSIVKRTVSIQFPDKRKFTRNSADVNEEKGIYEMRSASYLREHVLTPSVRRAFFRYWINFSAEYPVDKCEDMLQDLRKIDREFGSTLQKDTEKLCSEMVGRSSTPMQESYDSVGPVAEAPLLPRETSRAVESEDSSSLLSRVHRATGPNTSVRAYKLCFLPDDVLPGIRQQRSSKNKPTKIGNFNAAMDRVSTANVIQLFGRTSNPAEFHRLDIDAVKFETLTSGRAEFGSPRQRGDIFATRYDVAPAETASPSADPPGLPQEPVAVREIANIHALREYLPHCSDRDSKVIDSIVNTANSIHGSENLGSLIVPYSNTSAYGRKYARSTSCQKLSRLGRCAAFRSHGVDLDIKNCHPILMMMVLQRAHGSDGCTPEEVSATYPMICLYNAHYKAWRGFVEEYYDFTPKEAKVAINTIFGGGRCPKGDIPFLHALKKEVQKAVAYLCSHRFYTHLQRHYAHRARPLFAQNAAILSFEEDRVLEHILKLVKNPPICLMYDGAIFEARSLAEVEGLRNECMSAAAEVGVEVEVKQWGPLPHVEDKTSLVETWERLQFSGEAEPGSLLVKIAGVNMCLYNSVRFLQLPEVYDVPQTAGPFNVSHFNSNVSRYVALKDTQAVPQYLVLCDKSDMTRCDPGGATKFVCYCQPASSPASIGHFFAVVLEQDGSHVQVMDDCMERCLRMETSAFAQRAMRMVSYVFSARELPPTDDIKSWFYAAEGGARAGRIMSCEREKCVECGAKLYVHEKKKALVYGFHAATTVQHVVKSCGDKKRRTRHWNNYRVIGNKKVYFDEGQTGSVLFLNSGVAFDVIFLRYAQQLQFIGFVSTSAVSKSHAAVFGSPRTSHFRNLLSDALFLLHSVTAFREIGYGVNTITLGDEITEDALRKYSSYLLKKVFPPRYLVSVTAVVADGNAKVMAKCSKNETPPKRAGAPRKDNDGLRKRSKPYWNGWFFFLCPKSGRVLQAAPMYHPENNAFVLDELEKVLATYPFVDCFIYDRACKVKKDVVARKKKLSKIRTYTTDKFHGSRHKPDCEANPYAHSRLMHRIRNLNTSIAEQTFSWFRGYARSLNELKPMRHQFVVLLYARMHNDLISKGDTTHLNPYSHCNLSKKRPTPYECNDSEEEHKRKKKRA